MFDFALAAFNISDGVFLGFIGLFLIIGLKRGFSRSTRGIFFNITLLVAALFFSGTCTNPIMASPTGSNFVAMLENWISGWGDAFSSRVFFDEGVAVFRNNSGSFSMEDLTGGNFIMNYLVGFLVSRLVPQEGDMSLAQILAPNLASIFMAVILFAVSFIVLKLLFAIITGLWSKAEDSLRSFKPLDRVLGMVFSVGTSLFFVLFVFAIIGITADVPFMSSAANHLKSSGLCSILYGANPVFDLFVNMFGKVG